MLFYYLQVGFGHFDGGGQDILDADDHIRFIGLCGDFPLDATEIAFDDPDLMPHGKGRVVEADAVGAQIHDEHEVRHLLVGNDQHGAGGKVAHIEKGDPVDIGDVTGGLFGGTDKYEIADDGNLAFLPAILQLGDDGFGGKIEIQVYLFFRFQPFQHFPDSKLLLVTGTGGKPIFLILNHLWKFFGDEGLRSGYASRFERDIFPLKPDCTSFQAVSS